MAIYEDTINNTILDILTELGTPAHIKGHPYLVTGLTLLVKDPNLVHAMTKELYPAIAKEHDTTPSRVERAVRHAVEVTWDRSDLKILDRYFGNTVKSSKGKPTNSEFLAQMCNYIRRELKGA